MAEKVAANDAGKKARAPAPKGHNLDDLRKKLAPFTKAIFEAYDAMETDHGSHVLTINHKFEKAAESTGFPKSLLRQEVARMRRRKKDEEREKAMADEEREDIERFRAAMDGTPFGAYAAGQLASA